MVKNITLNEPEEQFIASLFLLTKKPTIYLSNVDEDNISKSCENIDGCGDWATDYWGFSGKEIANLAKELEKEFTVTTVITVELHDTTQEQLKEWGYPEAKLLPIPT